MHNLQIILFILGGAFALWQIAMIVIGAAMVSSGGYTKVRFPMIQGVIAVILFIAAVLVG